MFALIVRFQLVPDRAADFDRLVADVVPAIRAGEPGTLAYLPMTVEDDPSARIFIELYADEAAFAEHEAQEHTQRFLRDRTPMLESVRVERLSSAGAA